MGKALPGRQRSAGDTGSARPLLDKLGIKAGMKVSVVGVADRGFLAQLKERNVVFSEGVAARGSDAIFLGADQVGGLEDRLRRLKDLINPNGAVWVVRPRGGKQLSEAQSMQAGLSAGLVDVKVVRFSDTHTAEKFVIRLRDR